MFFFCVSAFPKTREGNYFSPEKEQGNLRKLNLFSSVVKKTWNLRKLNFIFCLKRQLKFPFPISSFWGREEKKENITFFLLIEMSRDFFTTSGYTGKQNHFFFICFLPVLCHLFETDLKPLCCLSHTYLLCSRRPF